MPELIPPVLGQFSRPKFTAPVVPSAPPVFDTPSTDATAPAPLPAIAAKIPGVVANPFATVNPALARVRSDVQEKAATASRNQIGAVQLPPALPASVVADPSAVTAWGSGTSNILAQSSSTVDEFGNSLA